MSRETRAKAKKVLVSNNLLFFYITLLIKLVEDASFGLAYIYELAVIVKRHDHPNNYDRNK